MVTYFFVLRKGGGLAFVLNNGLVMGIWILKWAYLDGVCQRVM